MTHSAAYQDFRELLVKPLDRVSFITLFCLLTIAGNLAITYIAHKTTSVIYMQDNFVASTVIGLIAGCIVGLFIGSINGFLQYFFLRRYFIREWIIAVAVNSVAYSTYSILVLLWYVHAAYNPVNTAEFADHPIWLWLYNNYFHLLNLCLFLIQGAVQWLVFQSYLKKVDWWLIFPLIMGYLAGFQYLPFALILWLPFRHKLNNIQSVLYYLLAVKALGWTFYNLAYQPFLTESALLKGVAITISALEYLLRYNGLVMGFWFDWVSCIFTFTIFQAIAICYLRKQEPDENLYLDETSAFTSTSDLNNKTQTKSIINQLQAQINTVWQQELNCRFPLTYWLAVNAAGSVVAYHPVNQVSQDNLELTPLPQLVGDPESATPTAKLQLTFFPPMILELKPLSGKSIPKIAIETLFITIASSYFIFSFIIYV
ncbi:MAG: hypothetical protein AAFR63_03450 [Cyanobacteria bacterium J06631_6]